MASRRNTLPIQGLYDMKDSVIISQKNKMQTLNNNVSDCYEPQMIMSHCNTSENVPKMLQCLYSLIYEWEVDYY